MNPLHWPFGATVCCADVWRRLLQTPRTTHSHSRTKTPSPCAIDAIFKWLAVAQDKNRDGGIPAYYSLYGGFARSYPETTGYLIPTMLDYDNRVEDGDFGRRAVRAGQWLLGLQLDSGAFPGGFAHKGDGPSVFNSGQILFGLTALSRHTGDSRFQNAAQRVAHWLAEVQDSSGAWQQHTYEDRVHVYYTMVAWALSEYHQVSGDETARRAAAANIDWALAQRQGNGWLEGYNLGGRPVFLHFIAYALQGLLEAGRILGDDRTIDAVTPPAERLLRRFEIRKRLSGAYKPDWSADGRFSCLTGNAQIALVWLRLAEMTGDLRFLNAALKINEMLKANIAYRGPRGVRGAVKGSVPVWGKYQPLRYPNWAAKFTADSLMTEQRMLSALSQEYVECES